MPDIPLDYSVEHSRDLAIAKLGGALDITQIGTLEEHFARLAASKPARVVLDMSGVTMISSVAIGSLLRLHQSLSKSGGKVLLAALPTQVRAALLRSRLDYIIPIKDSVKAALAERPATPKK